MDRRQTRTDIAIASALTKLRTSVCRSFAVLRPEITTMWMSPADRYGTCPHACSPVGQAVVLYVTGAPASRLSFQGRCTVRGDSVIPRAKRANVRSSSTGRRGRLMEELPTRQIRSENGQVQAFASNCPIPLLTGLSDNL